MASVKQFKWENQQSNLYKKQERNIYEPHQPTTTTEHHVHEVFMFLSFFFFLI